MGVAPGCLQGSTFTATLCVPKNDRTRLLRNLACSVHGTIIHNDDLRQMLSHHLHHLANGPRLIETRNDRSTLCAPLD
jgi:5-methylcytosine-specific restriction endonuclease McrA